MTFERSCRNVAHMTIHMPIPGGKPVLVQPDRRKRISLGVLAKFDMYEMRIEEDDTIVLVPVQVVPIARAVRRGPKPPALRPEAKSA